jgi:hypothetical protein
VWLWPDKDGVAKWQEVADKLGYDKCQVYTRFFDTCWTEDDGDKADVADIAIRMMRNPDFKPIETREKGGGEDMETSDDDISGVSLVASQAAIPLTPEQQEMLNIQEWVLVHPDEPFIDPVELTDIRVGQWRETLRRQYNFNKSKTK